ncbi:MAG: RNA polymerase sigma factor [Hyphomicrobiaceae bacterium]
MSWDLHKLFQQHAKEIARALRRRGFSEDTAADLTQDAFVRLLTLSSEEGAAPANQRAYLHRISYNLGIDYRRREALLQRVELTDEAFGRIADPAPSAEVVVYNKQRLAATRAAIRELPERTRTAFELHRLDGLTITEVAERLDLSTTRTWTLIRDAYRHIKRRLRDL